MEEQREQGVLLRLRGNTLTSSANALLLPFVVMGAPLSGKTSLVRRFMFKTFDTELDAEHYSGAASPPSSSTAVSSAAGNNDNYDADGDQNDDADTGEHEAGAADDIGQYAAAGGGGASYFSGPGAASVSAKFYSKLMRISSRTVRFQIWDTPGDPLCRQLLPIYYRKAHICLLVYQVADRKRSWQFVCSMLEELRAQTVPNAIQRVAIVGCKNDLVAPEVQLPEVEELAKRYNIVHVRTSALRGEHCREVFINIASSMIDKERRAASPSSVVRMEPPEWVPDEQRSTCAQCEAPFSVTRRRHHCRNCGNVFCGRCTQHRISIPRFGFLKPERVCDECFSLIDGG